MTTNRRRRWPRVAITSCLLLLVVFGIGVVLAHRDPAWWQETPETPDTNFAAEQVENTLVTELSRARPDDGATPEYRSPEWIVTITEKEANAWLATRARDWVENRAGTWPPSVRSIQLAFRPGRLLAGVHIKQDEGFDHVISVSAIPDLRADGSLWLKIDEAALGGLPLPSGVIISQVQSKTGASASRPILDALEGKRALVDQAIVKLDDGRYVRIVKADSQNGLVTLTCRTEKK